MASGSAQIQLADLAQVDADRLSARKEDLLHPAASGAEEDSRIQRVGDKRAIFIRGHGGPVERRDLAKITPAPRTDRARVLLGAIDPVREGVVNREVIDLG